MQAGRIGFHRACFMVVLLGFSGSPESRTQHYAVISRVWATGPRLPCANVVVWQVGMAGLEPALSCSQGTRAAAAPHPVIQSERADLNRRSPGPRPATRKRVPRVPGCDTQASLRSVSSSPDHRDHAAHGTRRCPSRTRLAALKGRCPQTDRRTGRLGAHLPRSRTSRQRAPFTQWTGRCSNPRLRLFRPPLDHLSYQSNKKSPMSL